MGQQRGTENGGSAGAPSLLVEAGAPPFSSGAVSSFPSSAEGLGEPVFFAVGSPRARCVVVVSAPRVWQPGGLQAVANRVRTVSARAQTHDLVHLTDGGRARWCCRIAIGLGRSQRLAPRTLRDAFLSPFRVLSSWVGRLCSFISGEMGSWEQKINVGPRGQRRRPLK